MHLKFCLSALCIALSSLAASAADPLWRATRETVYEPSETDANKLVLSYNTALTYTSEGLPVEEVQVAVDGTRMRRTLTYTPEGRMASELIEYFVGGEWVKYRTRTREYDRQTGIITLSEDYTYEGSTSYPGNCYRREITRNDDGNVTEVILSVFFNNEYDPTQRITIGYGEDARANSISCFDLTAVGSDLVWMPGATYTEIVWHETDGQIVSVDDFFRGANRIASAHYINTNNGKPWNDYDLAATYADEGPDFVAISNGLCQNIEDARITRDYKVTTAADGNVTTSLLTTYEVPTDPEFLPANYLETSVVDAGGFEIELSQYAWETDPEQRDLLTQVLTEVVYDPATGHALSATTTEDGMPLTRIEYSGYVDCTQQDAIGQLPASLSGQPAQYFDLQGRKLAAPSRRGFYIQRRGNEVNKILK